jgi:ABC-type lipoprotein export system ATPase subunit
LLRSINHLEKVDRGLIHVDGDLIGYRRKGERLHELSERDIMDQRSQIGFVFQSFNLLPRTSALDNVAMPLTYAHEHLSDREVRKRATELLERVGLADRMDHEPSQLSGGQQQRVAIARSLVNQPPLIFADEPTGNLDSKTSEETLQMFQQLNRETGLTIIIVTHDPGVARHARRVIHIRDGLIENDAPAGQGGGAC